MAKTGSHNVLDPRLQAIDEAERRADQAMQKIRAAAQPQPWAPAGQTVQKHAAQYHGAPQVFRSPSDFFRMVKSLGMNYQNWQANPASKDYVQKTAGWIDDVYRKSYGVVNKAFPSGLNETVAADGGVLVPPTFVNTLLQRVYDNDLLSRTTLFPMTGNVLKVPAVNEVSRADGSRFGGVQAYWEGEAQTASETKPGLKNVQLNLSKLMLLVRATDELLEDSGVALETFIESLASQELQFKVGDGIVRGDGVNKPEGILKAGCKITVAKETGQAAKSIVTENIVNMWARMFGPCRSSAIWLYNQDIEPQLFTMSLGVGTGGVATFMPAGGISAAPYATIMGRPAFASEFCSTVGTEGDLILWDPSTYLTGTRGGMQSAVSMHVYFSSAEQLFRFQMRLDGRSWWSAPLTPYQGTNTKSPVITLADRA